MIRAVISALLFAVIAALAPPAMAASFDCGAASTPFEHAICDNPELSSADETLAKAFATASGGLTKSAANALRLDQRDWLDFAQAACTDDAQPLTRGTYDEDGASCLVGLFNDRIGVLEGSRMLGRHRFTVASTYSLQQDPDAADDPDYYWKVATHELSYPLLDEDDALAPQFNAFIRDVAEDALNSNSGGEEIVSSGATSDTDNSLTVKEVTPGRITLTYSSYWYGHGAAHGNWGVSALHYMTEEGRGLEAGDVFDKSGWEDKLAELAFAQLKADHGEWLQVESADDIANLVTNPTRWGFDSVYGLTIQFQPYEVSAYAYGAPSVVVNWDALADYTAAGLDGVRYGN